MRHRGKYLVLGILLLAVLLGVGNMIYQTRSSGRVAEHWGATAIKQIISAPQVHVLKLADAAAAAAVSGEIQLGSQRFVVVKSVDASQSPGVLHIRRALVSDGLYDWSESLSADTVPWRYALRFSGSDEEVTLLLDRECLAIAAEDELSRPLCIRPNTKGISPLRAFVEEQFLSR